MGGIHICVAYPQRCVSVCNATVCVLQVNGLNKRPCMGATAPRTRKGARCSEDSGGAGGPSTVKGKIWMSEKNLKWRVFPSRRMLGRAMRRKAHRLALAEALIHFFVSYCVAATLNSVNFCLECPVFNALGVAVCRPNACAGR